MYKKLTVIALICLTTIILSAQSSGTINQLRGRVDSTNALMTSSVVQTPPYTYGILSQLRVKVDSNGNLVTASAGGGGTPGGANTNVQYNDNGAFGGDSTFTFDKSTKTLAFRFFEMPVTTQALPYGIMYRRGTGGGTVTWMHNFNYGTVGMVTTEGHNTYLGNGAGFIDTGGVGTPTLSTDGSENTGIGYQSLRKITVGHRNTCVGSLTCQEVSTANYNTVVGFFAGTAINSGNGNNAFGYQSQGQTSTGQDNAAFGHVSLSSNTSGNRNSAFGPEAGGGTIDTDENIFMGWRAGKYETGDMSTCVGHTKGIFIGSPSRCSADNLSYEYVFGSEISGNGSYTFTVGSDLSIIQYNLGDPPTCGTNCGSSVPAAVGNDSSFTQTLGTTPASGFVITFNKQFTTAPQCFASMGKAGMVVGKLPLTLVTTQTTLTVVTNGTAPASGDIYHFACQSGKDQ